MLALILVYTFMMPILLLALEGDSRYSFSRKLNDYHASELHFAANQIRGVMLPTKSEAVVFR